MHPAPVPRGVCQRLQTRGGERWPGNGRRRRCGACPRRSKPHLIPACRVRTPRPLTAGRPVVPSADRQPSAWVSTVESHVWVLRDCVTNGRPPGRVRSKPQTPRAGRLGFGGLAARFAVSLEAERQARHIRTSTRLDVARRRGPRVQLDPWRPARPRLGGGRQKSKEDGPTRGLDKEYGRWRMGLPGCLVSLVEAGGRRIPATPVTALQQFWNI